MTGLYDQVREHCTFPYFCGMTNKLLLKVSAYVMVVLLLSCGDKKPASTTDEDPIMRQNPSLARITAEIDKTPKDAALYYDRGRMLQRMRQDTLALRDYKHAATLDSTKAVYFSAVGDMLFEQKDLTGSIAWIEKAIKLNPQDPKAHLKIAKLFLYLKEYEKAFSEINLVLRKNVYEPEAYFLKGLIYQDIKDTAKAISNLQTAIQVAPNYREAVLELGMIHSAQKNPLALRYLQNAFEMDTTDVFPLYAQGVYYQDAKDMDKAKAAYRNCIRHDRQYTDAYFNMGYLLMQEDSTAKAWRQYNMAIQTDPSNPAAYFNRGLCSEILDSMANAVTDYRTAARLDTGYLKPKEALKRLGAL